jgi:hypothetical protein
MRTKAGGIFCMSGAVPDGADFFRVGEVGLEFLELMPINSSRFIAPRAV